MRFNRFIINCDLSREELEIEDPRVVHQLSRVLRARAGEIIFLSTGRSLQEAKAEIKEINKKKVKVKIISLTSKEVEPNTELTVFSSLIKKDRFEWLLEKATELGVRKIVPILADRTVKLNFKRRRWEKIILEATEQSGRVLLPELSQAISLKEALGEAKENDFNLFFHASGEEASEFDKKNRRIGVFIGPEGGWSEKELQLAGSHGLGLTSLGKTVLRSETAGIAASALILLES